MANIFDNLCYKQSCNGTQKETAQRVTVKKSSRTNNSFLAYRNPFCIHLVNKGIYILIIVLVMGSLTKGMKVLNYLHYLNISFFLILVEFICLVFDDIMEYDSPFF